MWHIRALEVCQARARQVTLSSRSCHNGAHTQAKTTTKAKQPRNTKQAPEPVASLLGACQSSVFAAMTTAGTFATVPVSGRLTDGGGWPGWSSSTPALPAPDSFPEDEAPNHGDDNYQPEVETERVDEILKRPAAAGRQREPAATAPHGGRGGGRGRGRGRSAGKSHGGEGLGDGGDTQHRDGKGQGGKGQAGKGESRKGKGRQDAELPPIRSGQLRGRGRGQGKGKGRGKSARDEAQETSRAAARASAVGAGKRPRQQSSVAVASQGPAMKRPATRMLRPASAAPPSAPSDDAPPEGDAPEPTAFGCGRCRMSPSGCPTCRDLVTSLHFI